MQACQITQTHNTQRQSRRVAPGHTHLLERVDLGEVGRQADGVDEGAADDPHILQRPPVGPPNEPTRLLLLLLLLRLR